MVSGQSDVSLLDTVGCNQSVDLFSLNIVQLLDSSLDLALVGLQADLENQGVTVLNLLDSSLRSNRRYNNQVGVQIVTARNGRSGVGWVLWHLEGLWHSELGRCSDLSGPLEDGALQSRFLSSSSLSV